MSRSAAEFGGSRAKSKCLDPSVDSNFIMCRFHKIQRKRLEKLGNKQEVTEEDLVRLRAKVRES